MWNKSLPVVRKGLFLSAVISASASGADAPQAHFDIFEYRVLGNTVLSNRDIEAVLYPLLGEQKTLTDVEAARAALEKTFHDRGFGTVFVDIPEQDVDEKIVRLKVTEGRLNEVRIAGARYFSERKSWLEVRGTVAGTAGGGYSGTLNLALVPLPPGLPLLLSGLGVLGFWGRRRLEPVRAM